MATLACQSQGRNAGGVPTPTIGTLPAATHQDQITLVGEKYADTGIFIDGIERVPRDSGTLWTAVVDLQEGLNTFEVDAMDEHGYISDTLTVTIRRDTEAPAAPTVDPSVPSSRSANPVTLSGTKESGTFIRLNGRRISTLDDGTTWEYQATLLSGSNDLRLTAVDAAGNESAPVITTITLTNACAAPPHPVFPLDGGAVTWGTAFSWTQQVPAGSYVFELSANPAFTPPFVVHDEDIVASPWTPDRVEPGNGMYYWRVGAVDACGTTYGETRRVMIGSTTGDVNRDGVADILVGANTDNRADIDAGSVYLYEGGSVADTVFDGVFTGTGQRGATFGSSIAKVGDMDRDGYIDFLVGAPREDRDPGQDDDTGAAYLYWGGPTVDPKQVIRFHGEEPRSYFGMSVAGVGDVNGDGYLDAAIGAYQTDVAAVCGGVRTRLPIVGRVYVYFGGPRDQVSGRPDAVLTGETTETPNDPDSACRTGDEFGFSVAGAGDVNGDGYDDVAVGARGYDLRLGSTADANAGRAYVFFGGPWFVGVGAASADLVLTGLSGGDQFGASVAGAGDVNGDGFAELLVGAHQADEGAIDTGAAYLYFGQYSGVGTTPVRMDGAAEEDAFGSALARVGDVNGDGFADFVIGAYLAGPDDNGAVSFFLGNAGSTPTSAGTRTGGIGPNTGDQFGSSVAGPGDVDGDGTDDVVVGAPLNDLAGETAGLAAVIFGPTIVNPSSGSNPPDRLFTGDGFSDALGSAVN